MSSAPTNSEAALHRSSGFLATALRIARVNGSGTSDGGGSGMGSWRCFMRMARGVSAENGTRPVNIS